MGANGHFALARYRSDGSLDTSFGIGGRQTTAFGTWPATGDGATGVAIQRDGKIVVVGQGHWESILAEGTFLPAARYSANGSLDPSFGTMMLTPGPDQGAEAVALQPDGTIVIAGSGNTWDDGYYGPQRFLLGRSQVLRAIRSRQRDTDGTVHRDATNHVAAIAHRRL